MTRDTVESRQDGDGGDTIPCSVCYGVMYLTRSMMRSGHSPLCIGYRRTGDLSRPPQTIDSSLPKEIRAEESLQTLLVIGQSRIFEREQAKPAVEILFGIRVLVVSDDKFDELPQTPANFDGGFMANFNWRQSVPAHLRRQREVIEALGDRMLWQVSADGRQAFVNQARTFLPVFGHFLQSYLRRIASTISSADKGRQ
uniref:Uncharacterized protein n=1 Tax=Spongospora subterranea TaxID=70186 RepID=A0A0H5RA65_9EUKA|eukprot:CRZ10691.1 hypothetical protein [Spongospora subterranea]